MSEELFAAWESTHGETLAQGDYLPGCYVPQFVPPLGPTIAVPSGSGSDDEIHIVPVSEYDVIVLTQSCDLDPANTKVRANWVTVCPIYSIAEWEEINAGFAKKGKWTEVRKGRIQGLHLLPPCGSQNPRDALVVDLREVYSLPYDYLTAHAAQLSLRWRLRSPFTEHLSQTFGAFFMRVALPRTVLEEL